MPEPVKEEMIAVIHALAETIVKVTKESRSEYTEAEMTDLVHCMAERLLEWSEAIKEAA